METKNKKKAPKKYVVLTAQELLAQQQQKAENKMKWFWDNARALRTTAWQYDLSTADFDRLVAGIRDGFEGDGTQGWPAVTRAKEASLEAEATRLVAEVEQLKGGGAT